MANFAFLSINKGAPIKIVCLGHRDGSEITVSSRPSDAVAVAVRTGAPLFVADDLMESVGIMLPDEEEDDDDEEDQDGANPEELLGAAHAGCFNQALANNFGMIELEALRITTSVTIEFSDSIAGHPAIQSLHIDVEAHVPGISQDQFVFCAERARTNCTISKILTCPITMTARLAK